MIAVQVVSAIILLVFFYRLLLWWRIQYNELNVPAFEHDSVQLEVDLNVTSTGITPGGQSYVWYDDNEDYDEHEHHRGRHRGRH